MKKAVLIIAVLAVLGQLIVPPTRIVGNTMGRTGHTVEVYRRQPIWEKSEQLVFLHDDELPTTEKGHGVLFTSSSTIDLGRLVVPIGITIALAALAYLVVPGPPARNSG